MDLYNVVAEGGLRKYLIKQGTKDVVPEPEDLKNGKQRKKRRGKAVERYNDDSDDDGYFDRLADGLNHSGDKDASVMGREHQMKATRRCHFDN